MTIKQKLINLLDDVFALKGEVSGGEEEDLIVRVPPHMLSSDDQFFYLSFFDKNSAMLIDFYKLVELTNPEADMTKDYILEVFYKKPINISDFRRVRFQNHEAELSNISSNILDLDTVVQGTVHTNLPNEEMTIRYRYNGNDIKDKTLSTDENGNLDIEGFSSLTVEMIPNGNYYSNDFQLIEIDNTSITLEFIEHESEGSGPK